MAMTLELQQEAFSQAFARAVFMQNLPLVTP